MKTKHRAKEEEKSGCTIEKRETETRVTSRFLPLTDVLTKAVVMITTGLLIYLHHFEDDDLPRGSGRYGINLEQV